MSRDTSRDHEFTAQENRLADEALAVLEELAGRA